MIKLFKQSIKMQKLAFLLSVILICITILYICLYQDNLNVKLIIFGMVASVILMDYFIFTVFFEIFRNNMPDLYQEKRSLFGEPISKFSLFCSKIGIIQARNIKICIELYRDKIVLSKFNRCLIVTKSEQIEFKSSLASRLVDFHVDNSNICCYIRDEQYNLIIDWIKMQK